MDNFILPEVVKDNFQALPVGGAVSTMTGKCSGCRNGAPVCTYNP